METCAVSSSAAQLYSTSVSRRAGVLLKDHIISIPRVRRGLVLRCIYVGEVCLPRQVRQGWERLKNVMANFDKVQGNSSPFQSVATRKLERLKQQAEEKGSKFVDQWKDLYNLYKEDTHTWGIGTRPIFTIFEKSNGGVDSVSVDENEIQRRVGADPSPTCFSDAGQKAFVQERISHARRIARELEDGVKLAPKNSTIYKVESPTKPGFYISNQVGAGVLHALPFLKSSLLVFSICYGLCIVWGAYLLFSKKQQRQRNEFHEEEARIINTRKLKSQIDKHKENVACDIEGSVQPVGEESVFKEKLEEVRNMARQVRSAHRWQTSFESDLELQGYKPINEGQTRAVDLLEKLNDSSTEEGSLSTNKLNNFENLNEDLDGVRRLGVLAHLDIETTAQTTSVPNRIFTQEKACEDEVNIKRVHGESEELASLSTTSDRSPSCQDVVNGTIEDTSGKGRDLVDVGDQACRDFESMGTFACRKMGTDKSIVEHLDPMEQAQSHEVPLKASVEVKPRVIISIEEARAKIAARKSLAGVTGSADFRKYSNEWSDLQGTKLNTRERDAEKLSIAGTSILNAGLQVETQDNLPAHHAVAEGNKSKHQRDHLLQIGSPSSEGRQDVVTQTAIKTSLDLSGRVLAESLKEEVQVHNKESDSHIHKEEAGVTGNEMVEAEDLEWMRDKVLREIVFKVKANEDAGREPFYGLDAEEEKLFFKGLEKKFQEESDKMKDWIEEHVENMDYGLHGVGVDDPPDAYTIRWKDPAKAPKSQSMDFFFENREQILREKMETPIPPSSSGSNSSDYSSSATSSHSSFSSPVPNVAHRQPEPSGGPCERIQERQGTNKTTSANCKTVVTTSGQPLNKNGSFQHTKKWGKDLERKYEMERNPETRSLMREIGQDLENWVTEEEVEESSKLLSMGVEGEEEYIQRHYERVRAKINEQRERFGWEAMVNKYKEYQPEKEDELWWLDLSYVLCIGVSSSTYSVEGLYSLDMAPDFEEPGKQQTKNHVIAFQDRKDALKFCYLLRSKPDESKFDIVEVCPYSPKQLYKDAKSEGFKVTVLKKGQVAVHAGQTIDEVEQRIVEIGTGVYWEKFIQDRSIDVDTVLDQGFNYGPSL